MLYPFAPLYERLLLDGEEKLSDREIGSRLGVSETIGRRLRKTGVMNDVDTDRFCIYALGVLPCSVYGDAWWATDEVELERLAVESELRAERKARAAARKAVAA